MLPAHFTSLILDMDGVIWRGESPIGDLAKTFNEIRNRGLKFVFATNNATQTSEQYVARLAAFGVDVEPWQVITSAQAVTHILSRQFPRGAKIFMVGEDGVRQALEENGYNILSVEDAPLAEAVVMGIDREINFQKMSEATYLVRKGIPFFATNPDKTFPTPRGEIPGAGAWYSVVVTATEVQPVVAGKPYPFLMELAMEKMDSKKEETLVVGDRLETDIAAGQSVGCTTALVLSGVTTLEEADLWRPKVDIIANSLSDLVN